VTQKWHTGQNKPTPVANVSAVVVSGTVIVPGAIRPRRATSIVKLTIRSRIRGKRWPPARAALCLCRRRVSESRVRHGRLGRSALR